MKALRMLHSIWLVVVVCVVSVSAQPDWVATSQRAVLKTDWATVTEVAQQWKQHDPNVTIADWLLGYAGLATGDYNRALTGFSRLDNVAKTRTVLDYASGLANQNPKNAIAQMLKGDALARTGDYAEALAAFDEAVRLDARSALIYDVRGVIRSLAGKTADAVADFEQAIELVPKFADAHANLGLALLAAGSVSGAAESLTQALELAPDFALAYNGRGVAYALMEAWDEAERDFKKAAGIAPSLSFARGNTQFLTLTRSQVAFRQSLQDDAGDGRGSTLIAQSFEHRVADVGGGKTMDVFILKATPQTSTFEGMKSVMQEITRQLRVQNGLPDTWQPRFHMDAHGWNSTPIGQMPYAAAMAQQGDRDAVIALDLSSWYKWQKSITWDQNVTEAAGQMGRANAAINAVTGIKPSFTGNSGGAQAFLKLGEQMERGQTQPQVTRYTGFGTSVLTAIPFQERLGKDAAVPNALLARADGVLAFHTTFGKWSNRLAPGEKVANIQITDSKGKGIWHGNFNDLTLTDGRPNPLLEIGGAALRGLEPATIQQITGQIKQGKMPSATLLNATGKMPTAALPSIRALSQNLDWLSQSVKLLYKLAGEEPPKQLELALEFTRPLVQDLHSARTGQFNLWASQTLEQTGKFALKELPKLVDHLVEKGKLPPGYKNLAPVTLLSDFVAGAASQYGRRSLTPSVDELTHYLDGINKTAWFTLGTYVGGPKLGDGFAKGANLTAEIARGWTEPHFQKLMHEPVRQQTLQNWRAQVETATAYGRPVKTITEMYGAQHLKQIGFDAKTVAEFDNMARWANVAAHANAGSAPAHIDQLRKPVPASSIPLQDDSWRKAVVLPPHRFDSAGVTNYRLPSAALPGSPGDNRGGVKMKADVVKGEPADTSELFGSGTGTQIATARQERLSSPFLLFCAFRPEK